MANMDIDDNSEDYDQYYGKRYDDEYYNED